MSRREHWLAIAVIAVLMAAYVAGATSSASIQDTARDVYYAYSIRHGLWFPVQGPVLGGAIHLGPAWFYVLSLPLFISDGWLAVALFAAALSSLKFPLAFALGRRALDARFGLLWACALALPGWNTLEQLIFFNPNPAAACMLAGVLLWMRLRERPSAAGAFALGLLLALSLHVHPTCAPLLALGLHALWSAPRRGAVLLAMASGFALPFVPYVAHELAHGVPDAAGFGRYMKGQVGLMQVLDTPALLLSIFAGGPQAMVGYLWKAPLAVSVACGIAAAVPAIASAVAAARGWLPRGTWIALAAATVLVAALAAMLRATTPWYFTYAAAPFAAGVTGLGLWVALRRAPPAALAAACIIAIAVQVAVAQRVALTVHSGEGQLSSRILDVKEWHGRQVYSDTWFPAAGRASLGSLLCAPGAMTLHGHLAYVEDRSVGVDALFGCGRIAQLTLMGAGNPRHWVGLSRAFWSKLGGTPQCWIGSLGIAPSPQVPWPARGIPIADGRVYFPREIAKAALREQVVRFEAPRTRALLVTNPLAGYEGLQDVRVTLDGAAVAPVASNDLSSLFAARGEGPAATWTVTFKASTPEAIDIVLFEAQGKSSVDATACSSASDVAR